MIVPGILLGLLSACRNDPKEIDALFNKTTLQQDKAEEVTIIYSTNGHAKARLFANEFIRNEQAKPPYTDARKGLKIEFFNDSLQVENTLTARYGRWYENTGNILLRDSIVVVNKKGEQLHTEELVWNPGVNKFYSEKFVRIVTATQTMYGDGLEANQDFSWYEIKNPKGTVRVSKDQVPNGL